MEIMKNLTLAVANTGKTATPDWMVVVMGVGVVFVGLILIILICKIMGLFFTKTAKADNKPAKPVAPVATNAPIANRQEIIAAVTAACAEDMGKDISALRVISFKKL